MLRHYDKDGRPLEMLEWAQLFEDHAYKRVAVSTVSVDGSKVRVSTVWLGLDHRVGPDGPPLIFETMVFRNGSGEECYRYSTLSEAEAGHAAVVAALEEGAALDMRVEAAMEVERFLHGIDPGL
jgi:hypothetical protein